MNLLTGHIVMNVIFHIHKARVSRGDVLRARPGPVHTHISCVVYENELENCVVHSQLHLRCHRANLRPRRFYDTVNQIS